MFANVYLTWCPHVGLNHEQNLHKMRLLTFMQMTEGKSEIDYNIIQHELRLDSEEELEAFILDGMRNRVTLVFKWRLPAYTCILTNMLKVLISLVIPSHDVI